MDLCLQAELRCVHKPWGTRLECICHCAAGAYRQPCCCALQMVTPKGEFAAPQGGDALPEALEPDARRLAAAQAAFQQLLVGAAAALLLREHAAAGRRPLPAGGLRGCCGDATLGSGASSRWFLRADAHTGVLSCRGGQSATACLQALVFCPASHATA
jgi:hypothetical protein